MTNPVTRTCSRCGEEKPLEGFGDRSGHQAHLKRSWCRDCEATRTLLSVNRSKHRTAHRQRIRDLVNEIKNVPCADCSGRFPPYVMDFDHRDPTTKKFDIARAAARGLSKEKILAEVAKCDVVCSNCHRIRTWGRVPSRTL